MEKVRLLEFSDFAALMRLYVYLDAEIAAIQFDDRTIITWSNPGNSEDHLYLQGQYK